MGTVSARLERTYHIWVKYPDKKRFKNISIVCFYKTFDEAWKDALRMWIDCIYDEVYYQVRTSDNIICEEFPRTFGRNGEYQ